MERVNGGVVVVGSANLDIIVSLDHFPEPGETLLGRGLEEAPGGKGLNQAIAAARHSPSAFVGCVGDDEAGGVLLRHLSNASVNTTHVGRVDSPAGRAFIQVTPDGENTVVVMPLANRLITADAVLAGLETLRPAVVLAQLEIPIDAVEAAAEWTRRKGARFLLNASPIRDVPPSLLEACDPLVVNTAEAAAILGDAGTTSTVGDDRQRYASNLAGRLLERVRSVTMTDGRWGVTVGSAEDGTVHIPGLDVAAVDTTGAGDEFAGVLAAGLASGEPLRVAAESANRAAARIVSIPRAER